MKTQYFTASTLDGFIADPHDSLDWLFPLGNIEDTSYPSFIRNVGALAMGVYFALAQRPAERGYPLRSRRRASRAQGDD